MMPRQRFQRELERNRGRTWRLKVSDYHSSYPNVTSKSPKRDEREIQVMPIHKPDCLASVVIPCREDWASDAYP